MYSRLATVACLAAASVLAGCAGSLPVARQIDNTFTIADDMDVVWPAVIETFSDQLWPIDNIERASGLITTDWIIFGPQPYFDCGDAGSFGSFRDESGRFNVFVREAGNSTAMTVTTLWRTTVVNSLDGSVGTRDCVSTGLLEGRFHEDVLARIE